MISRGQVEVEWPSQRDAFLHLSSVRVRTSLQTIEAAAVHYPVVQTCHRASVTPATRLVRCDGSGWAVARGLYAALSAHLFSAGAFARRLTRSHFLASIKPIAKGGSTDTRHNYQASGSQAPASISRSLDPSWRVAHRFGWRAMRAFPSVSSNLAVGIHKAAQSELRRAATELPSGSPELLVVSAGAPAPPSVLAAAAA
eukprot:3294113-Pleurochrysis_carterae.AAC.6